MPLGLDGGVLHEQTWSVFLLAFLTYFHGENRVALDLPLDLLPFQLGVYALFDSCNCELQHCLEVLTYPLVVLKFPLLNVIKLPHF